MKRIIPILLWLGALLLIAVVLLRFEGDLLWKVQQYNLFLDTPLFFREQMVVPGGLLSYVSCFFTQFFFYPWMGVLMLCGWWLLLMWLTKRTFRIADGWALLALIPVAILLVADMSLGYWHYFMKLRGYFFLPTIGTTAVVAMLWVFRKVASSALLKGRRCMWCRVGWIVVSAVVGYPLMGAYALAAVLLMGIWAWRLSDSRTQSAILSAVALVVFIAVPLFFYRYVFYQTNIRDMWTTALPVFTLVDSYPNYYIPYYILAGFYLVLVVGSRDGLPSLAGQAGSKNRPLIQWSLQGILVVVLIAGVWNYWYKDDIFHRELAMMHDIENTDWEGVIQEAAEMGGEPTEAIAMMRDLALIRQGRLLEAKYSFPLASKNNTTQLRVNMLYHVFGRMIYYQYGLLNDCHRICMEDGVEYGWRVELQEYIARCSLLSGEKQAAQRALNLLQHTLFYGQWADDMQQLLDHPEQIAGNHETGPVSHMLHYKNALGSDGGDVEKYVMSRLADQDADDPYFQELAVVGTLWMKNPKQFFSRFSQYARLHPNDKMPRLFQEGAYLFGVLENRPNLDRFPFDKGVKETYYSFMREAQKYNNHPANVGRTALSPFFGNTYFYEYYFLRNGQE